MYLRGIESAESKTEMNASGRLVGGITKGPYTSGVANLEEDRDAECKLSRRQSRSQKEKRQPMLREVSGREVTVGRALVTPIIQHLKRTGIDMGGRIAIRIRAVLQYRWEEC